MSGLQPTDDHSGNFQNLSFCHKQSKRACIYSQAFSDSINSKHVLVHYPLSLCKRGSTFLTCLALFLLPLSWGGEAPGWSGRQKTGARGAPRHNLCWSCQGKGEARQGEPLGLGSLFDQFRWSLGYRSGLQVPGTWP